MPHARLDGLTDLSVAVATSKTGIAWGDAKTGAVYLVLLILAPKDSPAMYLQVISSLAKIFGDPEAPKAVAGMETAEEVWKFFDRGGLLLPDHICAGDIMNRDVVLVRETDPLEKAIDTFVDKDMVVLPVVDRDGELVGVVTAAELMRVCLPDYILWMDDLSPILNFEPFAQVLRNESKTWLAEIMRFDHAVVSVDAPAIDVAKELTKRGCREAFVLNGKKLVGVITLRDFLNKVLRE
jgi:CBS domain-containing protein